MAKNSITASERRGIIAVAALALLITGAGLWLSRCGRPETAVTPEEVQILLDGSSSGNGYREDSLSIKDKSKKEDKRGRDGKKKGNKSYRDRSHLDEHVNSE